MSCIAGILNQDGAPADRALLERMTGAMKARAPDEIGQWCNGNLGFGHAMLRISPESAHEHQPCTLDAQVWITADARIDGRGELIGRLRATGAQVRHEAPDAELILHAYDAFGESFLERIVGDFAFALWDARARTLICACDHFGLRPFYYAATDSAFVFASDVDALLLHPKITRVLDEAYIADFLLFGVPMENHRSVYRDIRRLPAASVLIVNRQGFRIRKYWDLPAHNELRHKSATEILEQFKAVFTQAVADRTRAGAVALELTGGLDSGAAAAVAAAGAPPAGRALTAYTNTCHGMLPADDEGPLAQMVATHLGMPIVFQAIEDYAPFARFGTPELRTAQPFANPNLAMLYDKLTMIFRSGARILLSGQGGDAVFSGISIDYANLLRSGRYLDLLIAAYGHLKQTRTLRGMGLRSAIMGTPRPDAWRPPFPDWINPDFAARVQLKDRFDAGWQAYNQPSDISHQMRRPWLGQSLESYEAPKIPVVSWHPFHDVRLVEFMLGLSNIVVADKRIMRDGMLGQLPEQIRTRPKTVPAGDHFRVQFVNRSSQAVIRTEMSVVDEAYVERNRFIRAFEAYLGGAGAETTFSSWSMITPISLTHWLRSSYIGV